MTALKLLLSDPKRVAKFCVALATALVTILTVALEGSLFPEEWTPYIVAVITVAGAYGVYAKRNRTAPGEEDGPTSL